MTPPSLTPMLHIPDVKSTIEWYESIGFTVNGTNDEEGEVQWAMLCYGEGRLMFNRREPPSADAHRIVDLYIHTDDIDGIYSHLRTIVPIHRAIENTFYGMREFALRDPNGFLVTFGMDIDENPD